MNSPSRFALFLLVASLFGSGCIVVDGYSDTYEECDYTSDCRSTLDYCQSYASSTVETGICTRECWDSGDCPATDDGLEPACLIDGGNRGICVETCEFESDCEIGFACERPVGSSLFICVPR